MRPPVSSWLMASLDQVIDLQAMASVRETQYGVWNGSNYNYTAQAWSNGTQRLATGTGKKTKNSTQP